MKYDVSEKKSKFNIHESKPPVRRRECLEISDIISSIEDSTLK